MLRNKLTCELSFSLAAVLTVSSLSLNFSFVHLLGVVMDSHDSLLQESGSELEILCTVLCRTLVRDTWMLRKKKYVLACILSLEDYSVCAKDHSCYNISQSD